MPTCILIRAAQVYAPENLGAQDLLIVNGTVFARGADLRALAEALGAQVVTQTSGRVIPGLIDQHMHFLGGGDGDGPLARQPELSFYQIVSAGVTTAAGILGSEIEAKTLPALLRRAGELERLGLTALAYTGAMSCPGPNLTGSIRSDIMLLDRVIGAKAALAERIFPNLDFGALATLAGELIQARANSGKACVLHMHIGSLPVALRDLRRLFDEMAFPIEMAVPTHVNRNPEITPLFAEACDLARQGMVMDITCCLGPRDGLPVGIDPVEAVRRALDADVPLSRITLSGDTGVAVPGADGRGMRVVPPSILMRDLKRLVHEAGLDWEAALLPFTRNIARVLGLSQTKGGLDVGQDADLVLLSVTDDVLAVMSRGRVLFDPTGLFGPEMPNPTEKKLLNPQQED